MPPGRVLFEGKGGAPAYHRPYPVWIPDWARDTDRSERTREKLCVIQPVREFGLSESYVSMFQEFHLSGS